jgi:hypothetical protein
MVEAAGCELLVVRVGRRSRKKKKRNVASRVQLGAGDGPKIERIKGRKPPSPLLFPEDVEVISMRIQPPTTCRRRRRRRRRRRTSRRSSPRPSLGSRLQRPTVRPPDRPRGGCGRGGGGSVGPPLSTAGDRQWLRRGRVLAFWVSGCRPLGGVPRRWRLRDIISLRVFMMHLALLSYRNHHGRSDCLPCCVASSRWCSAAHVPSSPPVGIPP